MTELPQSALPCLNALFLSTFFSFRPMSLHISHSPCFHLTTSSSPPFDTRTMKWLVTRARALSSALVHATSCFGVCLFMFILFLGDIDPNAPPFPRTRHSHCTRTARAIATDPRIRNSLPCTAPRNEADFFQIQPFAEIWEGCETASLGQWGLRAKPADGQIRGVQERGAGSGQTGRSCIMRTGG